MVKKYFVAAILLLTSFTLAAFDLHRQMTGVIICHSGTPTPSALCAAKELQTALKRTLDINAGIVSGTIPEKYSALFIVGEMEKYPLLEKLEWDAFTIDSPGKNILQLAGKDDHRKPFADYYRANTGTLYAVYRFMRDKLGIRMLWPDESGIIYPELEKISIAGYKVNDAPKLPIRTGFYGHGRRYPVKSREAVVRFGRFNGMGSSWQGWFNHSSAQFIGDRYFDSHPEYYAQIDGKRRRPGDGRPRWKICHSNRELPLIFARTGMKHPDARDFFPVSPNDGENYCECSECIELDGGQKAQFDNLDDTRCVSGRVFTFAQRTAEALDKLGSTQKIAVYAYSLHTDPPAGLPKLNDRVVVAVCKGINWNMVPQDKDKFDRLVTAWSKKASGILLRDYPGSGRGMSICCYPSLIDKTIKQLYRTVKNFYGIDSCGDDSRDFALTGPNEFVRARLCWDPEQSLDKLLDEYYLSGFPGSHRYMRAYFEYFERRLTEIKSKGKNQFPGNLLAGIELMSPQAIAEGRRFLAQARKAAKDKAELKRIDFMATGLEAAETDSNYYRSLIACGAIHGIEPVIPPTAADFKKAHAAIAKRWDFINKHINHGGLPTAVATYVQGNRAWEHMLRVNEKEANKVKAAAEVDLTDAWQFSPVAEKNIGTVVKKEYNDSSWKSISTANCWEVQGFSNYNGWGVYRKSVKIPADWDNSGNILLSLGAVDENCKIYCDGKLIGQHKYDPVNEPEGWMMERRFDLSGVVVPGKTYHIAIAVQDTSGNGGIWKPVKLQFFRENLFKSDIFSTVVNGSVSGKKISRKENNRIRFNALLRWAVPGKYRITLTVIPRSRPEDIELIINSRPGKKQFSRIDGKIFPASVMKESNEIKLSFDTVIPPGAVGLNALFFTRMKSFEIKNINISKGR